MVRRIRAATSRDLVMAVPILISIVPPSPQKWRLILASGMIARAPARRFRHRCGEPGVARRRQWQFSSLSSA